MANIFLGINLFCFSVKLNYSALSFDIADNFELLIVGLP